MMFPARTNSPPNFFTPLRCPALSRPFRELPPAFLCAIIFLQKLKAAVIESEIVPMLADIFHAHSRIGLSVSLSFPVTFAAFVLEDHDFGRAPLPDYGGLNPNAFHKGLANPQLIALGEKEHLIEGDAFPDLAGNLFYFDYMPGPGFILPPPGPEDGVHRFKSSWTATGYAF